MVGPEHGALHLEEIGRVAHVAHEVGAHVRDRLERRGVDLLPGLEHRIGLVPRVQRHLAGVGVDRRLHRVSDVVHVVESHPRVAVRRVADRVAQAYERRVRVVGAQGVAVDDPDDPPVDDRRVRVVVELQVRCHLLHARDGVTVVEDLRLLVDGVGEEDVRRLELQRVDHPVQEIADRGAAVAREGVLRLRGTVGSARVVEFDRVDALGRADDRVGRRVLTEVDPRFVLRLVGEGARRRDAALEEHGVPVVRALVALGRDQAVAVRVDEGRRVPRCGGAELSEVQVAYRHDGVLRLPVDLVAVDVERVGELVVRTVLLELTDRGRDDRGVHDADGCRRVGILTQLTRLGIRRRREVLLLESGDAVRGLRRVDVALVVGALERLLVRSHLDVVDEVRVRDRQHEGRHDEQRRSDEREPPPADHRRHEEEDRDERGGDREDREPRDDRVHVDVARARDPVALRGERLVPVEPEARALHEQVEPGDDRELDARRLRDAQLALAHAHRPVQVGHERRDREADEQHGGQEPEERAQERQGEEVEPDVHVEFRVDRAGVDAVRPQPRRLPLRGRGEACEEAEEHGDAPHRQTPERFDDLLVVIQLRGEARVHGPQAVGELDRREDGDRHRREADEEHHDARRPLRQQNARESELVEPQPIGEQAREDEEAHHDDRDDGEGDADRAADGTRRGLIRR